MTRFTRISAAAAFLSLAACSDGDPGLGSTEGPATAPANIPTSPAPAPDGGADVTAPTLVSVSTDAGTPSPTRDAAPPFQDPSAGDGACTAPNLVCGADAGDDAGPSCVDVSSDALNCGACGNQCTGPSAACIAGACACTQLGFLYCNAAGGCVDTTTDVNNCGACGNVCDPTQFNDCAGGLCVSD